MSSQHYDADPAQGLDSDGPLPVPGARPWPRRLSAWLAAQWEGEVGRHLLWGPVGLGVGIAVYFQLAQEPPPAAGPVALAMAVLMLLSRVAALRALGIVLLLLAVGFTAAQLRTSYVASPILRAETRPIPVEGRVIAVDRLEEGLRVLVGDVRAGRLPAEQTPQRVRIRLHPHEASVPEPGRRIRVLAILRPPPDPAIPGGYDFRRHAYFERLGAVGFALGRIEPLPTVPAEGAWDRAAERVQKLRDAIADRVAARLDGAAGAVTTALLNGQKAGIPAADLDAMRQSGLQHLLSISGLHVGLVAGLVFVGLRAGLALLPVIALRRPIKKWAAAAALVAAAGYMLLVGAPVPTQRAVLMTGVMLLAVLVDRSPFTMRVVAVAATLVLLAQPEALVGPSFQMSFAAVIALIAAYETVAGRLAPGAEAGLVRRAGIYTVGLSLTSLVAGTATTPYALYHFQLMSNYGLLANLIAVPITSFWVMPCGVLALLLMPLGLEGWALEAMGAGVSGILWSAHWVAGLPGASLTVPAMPAWGIAVVTLGGLWLAIWTRPWRLAGLILVAIGIAGIWLTPRPDILVNGDGRLVGLRAPDGTLWVSSARTARFDAETWQEREGLTGAPPAWPRDGTPDGWVRCDPAGCIAWVRGRTVAVVRTVAALAEDCAVAEIVITPVQPAGCSAPHVIGPAELQRRGAHALHLGPTGVDLQTARAAPGARPWN